MHTKFFATVLLFSSFGLCFGASKAPTKSSDPTKEFYVPKDLNPETWTKVNPTDPRAEVVMQKIASQPIGLWVRNADLTAHRLVDADGKIVLMTIGIEVKSDGEHLQLCRELSHHTRGRNALIIVGYYGLDRNFDKPDEAEISDIKESILALKSNTAKVFLNMTTWKNLSDPKIFNQFVTLAMQAGLNEADGIALNVGKDDTLEDTTKLAEMLYKATGKQAIVSTSRAGVKVNGKATLGPAPTMNTGNPAIAAYVFATPPGEGPDGKFDPDNIGLTLAKGEKTKPAN